MISFVCALKRLRCPSPEPNPGAVARPTLKLERELISNRTSWAPARIRARVAPGGHSYLVGYLRDFCGLEYYQRVIYKTYKTLHFPAGLRIR